MEIIRQNEKGLSAGRNAGIKVARGEILAFVDDEVTFGPDYFLNLKKCFTGKYLDAVAGRILKESSGEPYARTHRAKKHALGIHDFNYWLGGNMILARETIERIGLFDENFGVGKYFGSGEDLDYFYRLIQAKMRIVYCPEAFIYHPAESKINPEIGKKFLSYGRGQGAVYAKALSSKFHPVIIGQYVFSLIKPLLRYLLYILTARPGRATIFGRLLYGRVLGFYEYNGRKRRVS